MATAKSLKVHIATVHHRERPYACAECDLAFGLAATLRQHVAVVHHSGRPFACAECEAKFGASQQLKEHIKRHRTERGLDFRALHYVIEVDETQCDHMPQSCECARMLNVLAQHLQHSATLRALQLRWLKIGEPARCRRRSGRGHLLRALEEALKQDFELWYLFYSVERPDAPRPHGHLPGVRLPRAAQRSGRADDLLAC